MPCDHIYQFYLIHVQVPIPLNLELRMYFTRQVNQMIQVSFKGRNRKGMVQGVQINMEIQ